MRQSQPLASAGFFSTSAVLTLLAAAWATSCDDTTTQPPPPGPNVAPQVVGSVSEQSMTPEETLVIDFSDVFADTNEDTLTLTAAGGEGTVDLTVVDLTVAVQVADGVNIVGTVDVGLTVTATDPDGLSATTTVDVSIIQPNRAPEVVGSVSSLDVFAGRSVTVDVAALFSDPDGDQLTYTIQSNDESVATAELADGEATLTGVKQGTALITIGATDPENLAASVSASVTVTLETVFEDDFSDANAWSAVDATVVSQAGVMTLSSQTANNPGLAVTSVEGIWEEWEMSVVFGRGQTDRTFPALLIPTGTATGGGGYMFSIGSGWVDPSTEEPRNYVMFHTEGDFEDELTYIPQASGDSDKIDSGADELTVVHLSVKDGVMRAVVEQEELFAWTLGAEYGATLGSVILATLTETAGNSSIWDHIVIRGIRRQ
ncbi:MAG: hypothetical protein J4G03_02065 [Gemmatimonadetes bacterium]|nr:hypothetical protein [Gemmatimonadota bacterium]